MTNERVLVAVFRVGDSGRTEDQLGEAILVDDGLALARPPLNQLLAREPCQLRVGIRWGDAGIEVIDVTRSHILEDAPELVFLELSSASSALTTATAVTAPKKESDPSPVSKPSRDDAIKSMREVLGEGDIAGNPMREILEAIKGSLN